MSKLSVGTVLSQMTKEANLSAMHVASRLGKTRQNVYMDFKKTSMGPEQIKAYADILGVDQQVIYDRVSGKVSDLESFGGKVLEDIKRLIEEELREKNDQIRSLQESLKDAQAIIKMTLGKRSLGGSKPWGKGMPMYKKEVA